MLQCWLALMPFPLGGGFSGRIFASVSGNLVHWHGRVLKICWTGYFDDFSAVSRPELQRSTTWAVESLFDLIGLDFAREGPKAPEFDAVFKMLGVQIDASEATTGVFAVGHTEDRKRELLKTFDDAIETGRITTKLAESLRGAYGFLRVLCSWPYNQFAFEGIWEVVQK